MWIAIIAIAFLGRSSDRNKTINLMEEYTSSMATSLASFFGEAMDAASYLATVQGEASLEWEGAMWGGVFI